MDGDGSSCAESGLTGHQAREALKSKVANHVVIIIIIIRHNSG